jgi:aspartyl aminopeptidase
MDQVSQATRELQDKVKLTGHPVWDTYSDHEIQDAFTFCDAYRAFLDHAKTEREAVETIIAAVRKNQFQEIPPSTGAGRIYRVNKHKSLALATMGKRSLDDGLRIIVSHIDSPRLDLKQNPLFQELDIALLRTHYYGGIKKYQWVAHPLALHGVLINSIGETVRISIGEAPDDPVFTICDLLPHLSRKTLDERKLKEAIDAEKMTILAGHVPFRDDQAGERVKLNILELLNSKYGIVEEDFLSAELELVPATTARDLGFDRSFVAAYGQDDRVCAYASLRAMLDVPNPAYTTVVVFLDKEEIGSEGNTGAKSRFLELFVADILKCLGRDPTDVVIRQVLYASKALSADVEAGMDPNYKDVHEPQNNAKMGYGVCLSKFTGSGGKYFSSDASAEYVAELRALFNRHGIAWQMSELGKVDEGGGGTVAKYLAVHGMDIIDCGPPLLGMHSPFEVASKADIHETYRAFKVFLEGT